MGVVHWKRNNLKVHVKRIMAQGMMQRLRWKLICKLIIHCSARVFSNSIWNFWKIKMKCQSKDAELRYLQSFNPMFRRIQSWIQLFNEINDKHPINKFFQRSGGLLASKFCVQLIAIGFPQKMQLFMQLFPEWIVISGINLSKQSFPTLFSDRKFF